VPPDVLVFHAGTRGESGRVLTAGGRVLTVAAAGPDLGAARRQVYEAVDGIRFEGRHYRCDIAARELPAVGNGSAPETAGQRARAKR
jgi:phosphoribosylamine--glycine ligase